MAKRVLWLKEEFILVLGLYLKIPYFNGVVPSFQDVVNIIKNKFGGSGVIPWQSYPKMIDKRYMKNGRSDTPCS